MTTALYRSLLLAMERRRLKLGWPMWWVDEKSGVQSGYYAKMLYSETDSGRRANWLMLQYVVDALWPDGIGVVFCGEPIPDDGALRQRIEATARRYRKRRPPPAQRAHLRTYASAKEARP